MFWCSENFNNCGGVCGECHSNGALVTWEYEPCRNLITFVSNDVYSTFLYTYDAAGRRISKNDEQYSYNVRNELILATNVVTGVEFAYLYDDIGNRLWSREFGTNTTYVANCLNQYTDIVHGGVVEHPAFDVDGSQTDITTSTGRWLVEYNGENRPVRWTRPADGTVIEMSYDRMGRRVRSGSETFVYDGYLNVGNTIWDPTESIATRPLVGIDDTAPLYYFHDGNKNVTDVTEGVSHHYEYAPFGQFLCDVTDDINVWQFGSECFDVFVGLNYYNYRHLDSRSGRWLVRDSVDLDGRNMNLFLFCRNDACGLTDMLGLFEKCPNGAKVRKQDSNCEYRSDNDNGNPKTANGCGAEGGISVPNSFVYIIDFTDCCDAHDVCYGTCAENKSGCDAGLGLCMAERCTSLTVMPILHNACVAQAAAYAAAVLGLGGEAYENAQDSACQWQPCCCNE